MVSGTDRLCASTQRVRPRTFFPPSPILTRPCGSRQGKGARYDGTFPGSWHVGSCPPKTGTGKAFSSSYKVQLRKLFELQTSIYESAASGWIMWTWKTEAAADWDYQRGLAGGWIPRDPGQKKYGNQCR